jgi:hypothetical protein
MEKKIEEQIQYAGHRLHIWHGCQTWRGLFPQHRLPFKKVFMLPDKTKTKTTNKMRLKHIPWPKASKINIVPNRHSTLSSVPKMADADYIAVFDKKARIYNATTTIVSASKDPILVAPCCQDTGLWKLNLD